MWLNLNDWKDFVCVIDDLYSIAHCNKSFDELDLDDLKNLYNKIHKCLHILKTDDEQEVK